MDGGPEVYRAWFRLGGEGQAGWAFLWLLTLIGVVLVKGIDPKFLAHANSVLHEMRVDFDLVKDYVDGNQSEPYAPPNHSEHVGALRSRSIFNLTGLLVEAPSQVCIVEGYRRGRLLGERPVDDSDRAVDLSGDEAMYPPEFQHWLASMEGLQTVVTRSALTYGHSYVVAMLDRDGDGGERVKVNVLPTRSTVAFYEDVVNDARPKVAIRFREIPEWRRQGTDYHLEVHYWDERFFHRFYVTSDYEVAELLESYPHGADGCPVVRYAPFVDDEGESKSVVKAAIPSQDRVNQAVFGTNITSDFGAFKVRYAAGLMPSYRTNSDGELVLDQGGKPIPEPIEMTQARMLTSTSADTKFGTLDSTPLEGYIRAEETAIRNFATARQFPAHIFLGNVSQLSAEALAAAEAQFTRWVGDLQRQLGVSHMELFRVIAGLLGDRDGAEAYGGEVRWRPFSHQSFAQVMDGLAKGVESLGIPRRGAWAMVPNVSSGQLEVWEELAERELGEAVEGMASSVFDALDREVASSVSPLDGDEVVGDMRRAPGGV